MPIDSRRSCAGQSCLRRRWQPVLVWNPAEPCGWPTPPGVADLAGQDGQQCFVSGRDEPCSKLSICRVHPHGQHRRGVPDPRSTASHVRLGDVVVSNEKGVLQYDNVKRTSDHIEIRDNSPKPGAALIAAAKALESDFDLGRHPWEAHLNKAECSYNFQRPAPETDVLHDARDQANQIPHPKDPWRDRHPTSPRIHLVFHPT